MTNSLEIQKYSIFRRLYNRLKVISSGEGSIYLSQTIQPVTNVDELLREYRIVQGADIVVAATTGAYNTAFTVPRGERWTIRRFNCSQAAGDNKLDILQSKDASTGITIVEERKTPTALFEYIMNPPIVLDELDSVIIHTDGSGVAETTFYPYLQYFREESYEPGG